MFKFCSQQQLQLLPSLLDEHLEEDHLAGFISAAVNQFDITEIVKTYSLSTFSIVRDVTDLSRP